MIVFDSIWPDIDEKVDLVRFQWKGDVFFENSKRSLVWFGLVGFMAQDPLQVT